ncbi:tetratricopeptide repeat protein [Sulfuriflexus mobilis]|uniref:L,D-transpeptidase Cds6 family protein n=1 Tax=Sulfuriflexus mobilis TaxID=1811807 RepID=UPI000F83E8EF|nr:tetratricopeptide repeat protein [Sulfuriflexus mobilis]
MKKRYFLYLLLALSLPVQADLQEARSLLEQGRPADALREVELQLAGQPKALQARFLQAQLLDKLGRDKEAIAVYEDLSHDYPQLPEPYNNLAVLYAKLGEHNKARDALLNAINTHPSYATAYENLGNIYTKMAISAYNKALELGKQKQPAPITLATIERIQQVSEAPVVETKTATPAPASPPLAVLPPVIAQPINIDDEVKLLVDTVNGWSNAWSAQNVDGYLAYYAPAFMPANGVSRRRWEQQRRQRLRSPRFIRITINEPEVKILGSTTARMVFEQGYESDRFKDAVKKVLLMEKIEGQWQILREYNS